MKKLVGWTCLVLVVALISGLIGEQLGFFRGTKRVGVRAAEAMANAVYRSAAQQNFDAITTDELASNEIAEGLEKADKEFGIVRSWKVIEVKTTPILLPVVVELEVMRNKKGKESLVIHSPFRFHDYWPPKPVQNATERLSP